MATMTNLNGHQLCLFSPFMDGLLQNSTTDATYQIVNKADFLMSY
jgi:hypothetical protein